MASRLVPSVLPCLRAISRVAQSSAQRLPSSRWARLLSTETGKTIDVEPVNHSDDPSSEQTIDVEPVSNQEQEQQQEQDQAPPAPTEKPAGASVKHAFQTETQQLLNIVANSLYTDKEVFLRELISNGSDALEKLRYFQTSGQEIVDPDLPLEIRITADENNKTLTIQDTGVGMNEKELIENLGTIARSGSKNFVKQVMEKGEVSGGNMENIIGQFGVGFYSVFMISDKVEVFSRSALGDEAHYWTSDGSGSYELAPAEGVQRGTKIIIHLREQEFEFALKNTLERIIKKYSNFVGYPIYVQGQRMNTLGALWLQSKDSVTEQQHEDFYKYISQAYDKPFYRLHFNTDVPLSIHALFYFPEHHTEKYGMGRMEQGVSLYSRKVLIQSKSSLIMPEWLRFIRGVVDSEEIPLNISRENMQDSAMIRRIKNVLTAKVIKFLESEGQKNPERYNKFFEEFGNFIKEGIVADNLNKQSIAKLLRFDSSACEAGKLSSLDEYVSRMPVSQQDIFFLVAPNRQLAESSPYYEPFKKSNTEVLFLYVPIDEFVMDNLGEYFRRKLVSIESAAANANQDPAEQEKKKQEAMEAAVRSRELIEFLSSSLSNKVSSVKVSTRLSSAPAIIVDHESSNMRKMMRMMDENAQVPQLPKQKLEINPEHPVLRNLEKQRLANPQLASLIAEQVFDNALIAAGLLDDPRVMLARLNSLLESTSGVSSA